MTPTEPKILRFGNFEIDLEDQVLRKQGALIRLAAQPFTILALLAKRSGQIVERSEIREALWGKDTYVDHDQGINACIRQIRIALGDQASSPRFVETLARRGYRFLAPVEGDPMASRPAPQPTTATTSAPTAEAGTPPAAVTSPQPRAKGQTLRWATALLALISVVAVAALVTGRRQATMAPQSPPEERQVLAVLPFENLGPDPDDAFLGDGLTEELIARISRSYGGQLGVIARTSAMQFKNRQADVGEIAEALGADYLVEGSVRREGERVRVTAKLISASDDLPLWAGNYDQDLDGTVALQIEVSRKIAEALALELLHDQDTSAAATSGEAYQAYLRGRHLSRQGEYAEAEDHLRAALAIDPSFAPAYVEMANLHIADPLKRPNFRAAQEELAKALSLDDSLPEAHRLMARGLFYFDWDFEGARRELERALELNPTSSETYHNLAAYYAIHGRHEKAIESIGHSLRLDPLSARISSDVAWYYYFARRYDEAIQNAQKTIAIESSHWSHFCLQLATLAHGDPEQIQQATLLTVRAAGSYEETAQLIEISPPEEARHIFWSWYLERLEDNPSGRYIPPSEFAMTHMALGDHEQALAKLERAYLEKVGWELPFLDVYPLYDPLRSDPRFQDLVQKILSGPGAGLTADADGT